MGDFETGGTDWVTGVAGICTGSKEMSGRERSGAAVFAPEEGSSGTSI